VRIGRSGAAGRAVRVRPIRASHEDEADADRRDDDEEAEERRPVARCARGEADRSRNHEYEPENQGPAAIQCLGPRRVRSEAMALKEARRPSPLEIRGPCAQDRQLRACIRAPESDQAERSTRRARDEDERPVRDPEGVRHFPIAGRRKGAVQRGDQETSDGSQDNRGEEHLPGQPVRQVSFVLVRVLRHGPGTSTHLKRFRPRRRGCPSPAIVAEFHSHPRAQDGGERGDAATTGSS
jgi:hypothetical protein